MANYSIRELEHLSGIKAHTIRIWEQRYGILSPKRTDTNIRYYDDADLKIILNVSLLNDKGFKISKIAKMSAPEIAEEILQLSENSSDNQVQINALVLATIEMNEVKFDGSLNKMIRQLGFEQAMLKIIYPFLNKIGILWQTDNICPAHEHFVSNIIRQKIIVAIDGQNLQNPNEAKRFLLFLPEGELHELALLFMHYLLRARHHHVMYLGQNLPFTDLQRAAEVYRPDHFVCVLTSIPEREEVQAFIDKLSGTFPESDIILYGFHAQHNFLRFPANVKKMQRITDFIAAVDII